MKVQENKGVLFITIPKDIGKAMKLEKGTELLVAYDVRDREIAIRKL